MREFDSYKPSTSNYKQVHKGLLVIDSCTNPGTVTDNSSYEPGKGALPSTGIPYVLVKGVMVVKDSKVQKVFQGKPIRFPVAAAGRVDQMSIEPRDFKADQ